MAASRFCMIFALLAVLVLSSCGPDPSTLVAQPLEDPTPVTIPNLSQSSNKTTVLVTGPITCGNSTCSKDQVCVKGSCQCVKGFKSCQGSCVPESTCCSDKDCQGTEICLVGKCQFSCTRVLCPASQVCDDSQKRCICPQGYRFCDVQDKCIPQDNCCGKLDCGGHDMTCRPTIHSVQICIIGAQASCKYLGEKAPKVFSMDNKTMDITATQFQYDGKVRVEVDGKQFLLSAGQREKVKDDLVIVADDIRQLGGTCKQLNTLG